MPNWTENELTITGPDVRKVLNSIRSLNPLDEGNQVFDFDRIIPYPAIYRDLDLRNIEYQGKLHAIDPDASDGQANLEALAKEYGVEPGTPWLRDGYNSGGYEWTCNHWGSKWNAARPVLTSHGEDGLLWAFIEFDTAWSPPIPVIEKLASMFPDHDFLLAFFEGGVGYCGQAYWEKGVGMYHKQRDYDGPRGG